MSLQISNQKCKGRFVPGFTLVELLIVIVIIGILATMAVPQYQKMVEKSKMSEGWIYLDYVRKAEMVYYAQYSKYLQDVGQANLASQLGIEPPTANKYYVNCIVYGSPGPYQNEWWVIPFKINGEAYAVASAYYDVDTTRYHVFMRIDTGKRAYAKPHPVGGGQSSDIVFVD